MKKKNGAFKDSKEVDLDKMLTQDMAKAIDLLGYAFLEQQGFETAKCEENTKEGADSRQKLKKQLMRKQYSLHEHRATKDNLIFYWFTLTKGDKKIAQSEAIKFECEVVNINK